eukprot:scaffold3255_cov158-Amphora_coffeaeformis.AAC.7
MTETVGFSFAAIRRKHKLVVVLIFLWTKLTLSDPLWHYVCTQDDVKDLPFCDTTLDVDNRVEDLLRRIPVECQISMMGETAAGYDPLYLPPYQWWTEGLHGVMQETCFGASSNSGTASSCATIFPCPSTLANSFNDTLDPRWGRNQEVPGEDPFLTSRFAIQYVKGLQQVHYEDAQPGHQPMQNHSRHNFDAIVSEQDLQEYYYVPFAACIQQSGVAGVMCAYNAVNDIPSCVSEPLLKDVLCDQWGFEGYVTSDCGALDD